MVLRYDEKAAIENDLLTALAQNQPIAPQSQVHLQEGNSVNDIGRNLGIYASNTTTYQNRVTQIYTYYNIPTPDVQGPVNVPQQQGLANIYVRRLEDCRRDIQQLDTEMSAIIEKVVNGRVKEVFETAGLYDRFSQAHEIPNIDQWWTNTVSEVIANPRHKTPLANELVDDELSKIYQDLTRQAGGIPASMPRLNMRGQQLRQHLFSNANGLEAIRNALDPYKDISTLRTDASSKITGKATEVSGALAQTRTEYDAIHNELSGYINSQQTNLNGSLQNLFLLLGENILTDDTALDGETDFNTLVNAYISNNLDTRHPLAGGRTRMPGRDPSYIERTTRNLEVPYRAALASGNLDDIKAVLNRAKALKAEVEKAKTSAAKDAKRDVKNWYRYVMLDAVQFDNPESHTGEFVWSMFGADGKIVDNHNIDTYAGAGLGFFRNILNENYFRSITDGDYGCISELQTEIVKKHKKNKKIGVNEALLWGLGHAIIKSHQEDIVEEINDGWKEVMDLDHTSSLAKIRRVYNDAANLGKELNHDTWHWTHRSSIGYDALDNELNRELCGWAYRTVDTGRDWLGRLRTFAGKANDVPTRARTPGYNVDDTAFEQIAHPTLWALLTLGSGAVAAYGIGKHIWDLFTKETTAAYDATDELFKEIMLFFGLSTAEKVLTGHPAPAPSAAAMAHVA